MDVDYVAQAERKRIRDVWLREFYPELRKARILETLSEEACKSLGYDLTCTVVDVKRGSFNLVHFVRFKAESSVLDKLPARGEWVIRIPLPDAPCQVEKCTSELAALQYVKFVARWRSVTRNLLSSFVREHTKIPVPQVVASSLYDERVKGPYTVLTKLAGENLGRRRWSAIPPDQRAHILQQLAEFTAQLSMHTFSRIGALKRTTTLDGAVAYGVVNRPLSIAHCFAVQEGIDVDVLLPVHKVIRFSKMAIRDLT